MSSIPTLHDEVGVNADHKSKREETAINILAGKQKWKEIYGNKHSKHQSYQVGDLVVIDHVPSATG